MKRKLLFGALLFTAGVVMGQTDDQNTAANNSLTSGKAYRIYTQYNGTETGETKYYLTARGTLTATASEACGFTFKSTSTSNKYKDTGWQILSDATHAFTNPSGGQTSPQAGTSLSIRVEEGNTKIRANYDAQVLFLDDDGNYAVRATNVNGTDWGANCYWNVAATDTELPNACYDINQGTAHFIWKIEADLSQDIRNVQANYSSTGAVYYYLQQVLESGESDKMTTALANYSSLQDIQLNTPYILNFLRSDNARVIVVDGAATDGEQCKQRYIAGTETQTWKLIGESFSSFKLLNANGLYYNNGYMTNSSASATEFSLDYNNGISGKHAWELHLVRGTGNDYALNAASGVTDGNNVVTWNDNDAGNALRFVLPEGKYSLTTSAEGSEVYYYLGFAETGYVIQGAASGSQAVVRPFNGLEAQQWALIGDNVNSFKLKNRATGLYLTSTQTMTDAAGSAESYILNISSNDNTSYEILLASKTDNGLNSTSGVFCTNLANWTAGDVNNRLVLIPAAEALYSLDDASDIDGKRHDLQLQRTFSAGWTMLCVPFNITKAQLCEVFGSDVEIYELTDESEGALTFQRQNLSQWDNHSGNYRDTHIVASAGKPYLLHISTTVTNPSFTQAMLTATRYDVTQGSVAFKGNYEADLSSVGLYGVTAAGQVKAGKDGVTFAPWTAYFQTTDAGVKLQVLIDGVATTIEEVDGEVVVPATSQQWYDLSGRRISTPAHGIYILNGKKVIVK